MGPTNPSSRKPWSHKEETTVPFFFQPTSIEQLTLITPLFLPDSRGYLAKTFESGLFASQGISFTLAEELESKSCRNTLRGLPFQRSPRQEGSQCPGKPGVQQDAAAHAVPISPQQLYELHR